MKKEILIDLDRLKYINTGLGQVALFFGKYLSKIEHPKIHFTFLVPKKFVGYFGNKANYETISLSKRYLPFLCKKYDLWYSLHQDFSYYPSNKKTPLILTIHDLNFLKEKTPQKAKKRLKKIQKKIKRATKITSISNFSKTEIINNLNTYGKEIKVIYNGVEIIKHENVKKPDFVPKGDILFSIGVVKEKKNTKVLVPFIEKLPDNYKLIIAGNDSDNYANEIRTEIKTKKLDNRIILTGQISDEEKYWLFNNCKAVLFPSKHEGMGIPPIEAMRFGKPVFASKMSSIPEICQDKAYYWDNFDPQYMADKFLSKINIFYSQNSKRQELINYSQKFDWTKNINSYLDLFIETLKIG